MTGLWSLLENIAPSQDRHKLGHEVDRHLVEHPHSLRDFLAEMGSWAKGHPGEILDLLRHVRPVVHVKSVCIALSYEAVTAVLANHTDFGVTYGPKMKRLTDGRNFFLGQDDEEVAGFSARALATALFRREDVAALVPDRIRSASEPLLAALQDGGNLVTDYLRPAVARFACDHFGLQAVEGDWLYQVTETLFEYLFIDLENDPELAVKAETAGRELQAMLERQIAISRPVTEETVIARGQRLLGAGVGDLSTLDLRNILFGLLIGLVPTTPKAAAMSYDWLTGDSRSEERLREASGNEAEFTALIREGMRLNPINPGLLRVTRTTARIPNGGGVIELPAGTTIFAATHAAMRDPDYVVAPTEIRTDRPASVYLNDGYGLHACFGRYINLLHVSTLLRPVMAADIRRHSGVLGELSFEGPFPTSVKIKRP
jgi:cytochrome P450